VIGGAFVGMSAATALTQRPSVTAKAANVFFMAAERNTANIQWPLKTIRPSLAVTYKSHTA
jgi:hypothetical protein